MNTEKPPLRLSITQIKAFERNPLYWAYAYYFKLPQPKTDALEYGKELHKAIECRLKKQSYENIEPFSSKSEKSVQILEKRFGNKIFEGETEKEFIEEFALCPAIKGIIDKPILNYFKNIPLIIDHKSVKNKKYALKPYDLKTDYQLIFYAFHVTNRNSNPKGCFVAHNQIYKEQDECKIIFTHISQDRIREMMANIICLAYDIYQFYFDLKFYGFYSPEIQLKKSCHSCRYQFGKCPYRDICDGKITSQEYLYNFYLSEKQNMKTQDFKVVELSELMKIAKDFYSKKDNLNKFEQREAIAESICNGIKKNNANAVMTSQFLMNGSDPDYTPVFTKLKESGIKILVEVN